MTGLASVLDRHFAEVPVKAAKGSLEFSIALVCLIRVVEGYLRLVEGSQQFLVHLRHLKAFPKTRDAHMVVADVGEPKQGIVALAFNQDL